MARSLYSDSPVLNAVASILARQRQLTKDTDTESLNSPLLVLTKLQGSESSQQTMAPNFEQVHALATASLLASTQLDIAKQLEEEEEANSELEKAKQKKRHVNKSSGNSKVAVQKKRGQDKKNKVSTTAEKGSETRSPTVLDSLPQQDDIEFKLQEPKSLTCTFEGCGRKFAWLTHLKYHELTHTNNRQFKCPKESCSKLFFTAQRLNVHLRTHTGEKPFKCDHKECGKTFTTAGNLKNHQRIHTGEQPFVCEEPGCNRRFTERSSLTKHKLTHSGDKPFECELCGKKFTQSGSRRQHVLRHHLEDEIRASLKQGLLSSGITAKNTAEPVSVHRKSLARSQENALNGACSSSESGRFKGGRDVNREEKTRFREAASISEGAESANHKCSSFSNPSADPASCSPQVLVLSNSYTGLPTSESTVYSQSLNDHIVTVTTQPINQPARHSERLSFSHNMLNSEAFSDGGMGSKSDDLVILSGEQIYHQGEQPNDMVYSADILDHEEVTGTGYAATHGLTYQEEITSTAYQHENNAEIFIHQRPLHPSYVTTHDNGVEMTISEYTQSESHPSQHTEATKTSCSAVEADFTSLKSYYNNEQHPYNFETDGHPCEAVVQCQCETNKATTVTGYTQPDCHSCHPDPEGLHHSVGEFISAEEVATAHHCDAAEFMAATDATTTHTGVADIDLPRHKSISSEVTASQVDHHGVEFCGKTMGAMDPMMECDEEEMDKASLV